MEPPERQERQGRKENGITKTRKNERAKRQGARPDIDSLHPSFFKFSFCGRAFSIPSAGAGAFAVSAAAPPASAAATTRALKCAKRRVMAPHPFATPFGGRSPRHDRSAHPAAANGTLAKRTLATLLGRPWPGLWQGYISAADCPGRSLRAKIRPLPRMCALARVGRAATAARSKAAWFKSRRHEATSGLRFIHHPHTPPRTNFPRWNFCPGKDLKHSFQVAPQRHVLEQRLLPLPPEFEPCLKGDAIGSLVG